MNTYMSATTVDRTRTSTADLPPDVLTAWARAQEIETKYGYDAWSYGDVPRGDKAALTRRMNVLKRTVERHGLDYASVLFRLVNCWSSTVP